MWGKFCLMEKTFWQPMCDVCASSRMLVGLLSLNSDHHYAVWFQNTELKGLCVATPTFLVDTGPNNVVLS